MVLLDPDGRAELRLPRVLATVSPRSLLKFGFEQLYIDRPELDIRRDAAGRPSWLAWTSGRALAVTKACADWLFSQREFVIRNGTLR